MYIPPAFIESDVVKLHDFIEQNSFALLVSQVDGLPFASHLPFLLDRSRGCLSGHMARANPQWKTLAEQTALVVFSGPHAYISPTWYEAEQVVPTWNYTAVHVYGKAQTIEEPGALLDIVQKTIGVYERVLPNPWTLDAPTVFVERLMTQIVGFRVMIEKMEGKWKLNQNHPVERREKVIRALQNRGDENSLVMADLVQKTLPLKE